MKNFIARLRSAPRFFKATWRNAFRKIPSEADRAAADKAIVRRIVMLLARGNVSLKMGRFLTEEMLDERWKRMFEYSFRK